jgi:hypothetical protein
MILFATRAGAEAFEGFPYALDLSRTLKQALAVLIVSGTRASGAFEEVMMAATFAEAGDFATVREILDDEGREIQSRHSAELDSARARCREAGIDLAVYAAAGDDIEAIRDTLKLRPGIEMVLLSPSLGAPRSGGYLKRILARITKPVVAISQPNGAHA